MNNSPEESRKKTTSRNTSLPSSMCVDYVVHVNTVVPALCDHHLEVENVAA